MGIGIQMSLAGSSYKKMIASPMSQGIKLTITIVRFLSWVWQGTESNYRWWKYCVTVEWVIVPIRSVQQVDNESSRLRIS
jgi:membrane protein YdbS with pleckstrin-like domain